MPIQTITKKYLFVAALFSIISLGNIYAGHASQVTYRDDRGGEQHGNFNDANRNNYEHHDQNFNRNEEFNRNINPEMGGAYQQSPVIVAPNQNNQTPQDIYEQNLQNGN